MKIIQFMNPKTKRIEKYVEISQDEKSAFQTVMDVLREIQKVVSDERDVFELKYTQKFLSMISSLKNIENITSNINEILMDDELIGNTMDQDNFADAINVKDIIDEVRNIIDSFIDQGKSCEKKDSANLKKKKPKKKKEDEYEQLKINMDEEGEKNNN